jgi:hypothetical protein
MNSLLSNFLELFDELYAGSNGSPSWVIDRNPGTGILGVLNKVSAHDASTPSVQGGTTIASHAEHLRWSLQFGLGFLQDKTPEGDWSQSWTVHKVNEAEWKELQQKLTDACKKMREAIFSREDWSNPLLIKGTLALLPHAAYHLGAIKQLLLVVKK